MTRDEVRNLKKAVRQGNKEAAAKLLERSIEFGHRKLAVLRCIIAERLGVVLRIDQLLYCQSAINDLSSDDVASILRQATNSVPRKS
jgi:hypothetical protein